MPRIVMVPALIGDRDAGASEVTVAVPAVLLPDSDEARIDDGHGSGYDTPESMREWAQHLRDDDREDDWPQEARDRVADGIEMLADALEAWDEETNTKESVMDRYELTNPHDDYSFAAPDDDVATTVAVILGPMYGWQIEDRSGGMTAFLDPESELGKTTLEACKSVMTDRRSELIDALRTVEIKHEQRVATEADPEKWHDAMRSSVADLRASAFGIADKLDKEEAAA